MLSDPRAASARRGHHRTKAETAHLYLREQILSGAIEPGQKPTRFGPHAEHIADAGGDALLRLEREGCGSRRTRTSMWSSSKNATRLNSSRSAILKVWPRVSPAERVDPPRPPNCAITRRCASETQEYGFMGRELAFHRVIVHAAADNCNHAGRSRTSGPAAFASAKYKLVPGHAQATIASITDRRRHGTTRRYVRRDSHRACRARRPRTAPPLCRQRRLTRDTARCGRSNRQDGDPSTCRDPKVLQRTSHAAFPTGDLPFILKIGDVHEASRHRPRRTSPR